MQLEFLSAFEKDMSKSRDKTLAKIVMECIQIFEDANSLDDIPNVKKLAGHPSAYR